MCYIYVRSTCVLTWQMARTWNILFSLPLTTDHTYIGTVTAAPSNCRGTRRLVRVDKLDKPLFHTRIKCQVIVETLRKHVTDFWDSLRKIYGFGKKAICLCKFHLLVINCIRCTATKEHRISFSLRLPQFWCSFHWFVHSFIYFTFNYQFCPVLKSMLFLIKTTTTDKIWHHGSSSKRPICYTYYSSFNVYTSIFLRDVFGGMFPYGACQTSILRWDTFGKSPV